MPETRVPETAHELTREDARRIAVRAQALDAARPADLLDLAVRLVMLQLDPTAAVAPSADVVCWSRLGPSYSPDDLVDALEVDRTMFELDLIARPIRDLGIQLAGAREWPPWGSSTLRWIEDNESFHREILDQLRLEGPLPAREIPDSAVVPWKSSGWNNNRNVVMMLHCLHNRGEIAVSGRDGKDRLWDLPERVYPDDVVIPSATEAKQLRDERRLSSLGIARSKATSQPTDAIDVGDAGEPATVEGVKGAWRVDPEHLAGVREGFEGRVALISPIDRLVYDRKRMAELFEFDYTLEQYKPAATRRWGYWAMPILAGDRLVGKLDATADRKAGILFVDAVHEDEPFSKALSHAVDAEIESLATWLGLEEIVRG